MQKLTSPAEATPMRVVLVTMDTHVASAIDRARVVLTNVSTYTTPVVFATPVQGCPGEGASKSPLAAMSAHVTTGGGGPMTNGRSTV